MEDSIIAMLICVKGGGRSDDEDDKDDKDDCELRVVPVV
jgi:hypothetical protein